jgi:hypothetical protein
MASITISVQSLLNTAVYNSYTVNTTDTTDTVRSAIAVAEGYDASWFKLVYNDQRLADGATINDYSIPNGATLRTANVIADLATRELRQDAKLALASLDRAASSRPSTLDISQLPTQYSGDTIVDNANSGGLLLGRPWA